MADRLARRKAVAVSPAADGVQWTEGDWHETIAVRRDDDSELLGRRHFTHYRYCWSHQMATRRWWEDRRDDVSALCVLRCRMGKSVAAKNRLSRATARTARRLAAVAGDTTRLRQLAEEIFAHLTAARLGPIGCFPFGDKLLLPARLSADVESETYCRRSRAFGPCRPSRNHGNTYSGYLHTGRTSGMEDEL